VEAARAVRGAPRADVADGYYERQKPEDPKQPKQPFYHRLADGQPFAFAGLWTTATPKDSEEPITSCSIITTVANDDVRFVHDRMPVILNGSDAEAAWLDPTSTSTAPWRWSGRCPPGCLWSIPCPRA
jgi:putative SOS response-associated peptidase YedK